MSTHPGMTGATGPASQRSQRDLEKQESSRQKELRDRRLYGPPKTDCAANIIQFPGETVDPGNVAAAAKQAQAEGVKRGMLPGKEDAAGTVTGPTGNTGVQGRGMADATGPTGNTGPTGKTGPVGTQAKQSDTSPPKFDHATALEFYNAVQPSAFILGFTQGRSITSAIEFQALAKDADNKRDHLFFPVATLKPEWGDPKTHAKGKITTPSIDKAVRMPDGSTSHVLECPYLWGDCDAEKYAGNNPVAAAKHYENEGSRVQTAIDKGLLALGIIPSVIWRSGAGWQFLIKLDQATTPDEAKTLVGKLHTALGFDPVVRNPNRILRVPGSVNWKDGKDGRAPSPCMPLQLFDAVTRIDDVRKALADIVVDEKLGTATADKSPKIANVGKQVIIQKLIDPAKYDDLNNLPCDIAAVARLVLAHAGDHPRLAQELRNIGHDCPERVPYPKSDNPSTNDNSRMALAVIGSCVRAGMSNEEIASLVFNQNYRGAFAHIFGQKDQHRAIAQCIKRAKEDLARDNFERATGFNCPGGWDRSTGLPKQNYLNTLSALDALGLEIRHDAFRSKTIINGDAVEKFAGEITDDQVTMIRHEIANRLSFHPHVSDMYDAITARSREHMFNPVVDWLDSLKWDGVGRLDSWMIDYLGAADTPYVRAVSGKTFMAAVRRAKQPGCKFDHMPILCGPQDIGKSLCIADCAGWHDLFSDADLLTKSGKEQLEAVEGKWFYEIAECDGMDRVALTKIKAFVTRQYDRARKAYGRNRSEVPRSCIFIGTSNDKELFRDPTGERRSWPIGATKYDRKAFLENREQIFAEAVARERGAKLWLDDADLKMEHAKKIETLRARDGMEDLIARLTPGIGKDGEERISSADVFASLTLRAHDLTDKTTKRVAVAMRRCGWVGPLAVRITSADGKSSPTNGYKRSKEAREAFAANLVPEGERERLDCSDVRVTPEGTTGPQANALGRLDDGRIIRDEGIFNDDQIDGKDGGGGQLPT